jgi:hypothetical protein
MADDTPTVEQARAALECAMDDFEYGCSDVPAVKSALDALIAAVRAEIKPHTQHAFDCAAYECTDTPPDAVCTCGLAALLKPS